MQPSAEPVSIEELRNDPIFRRDFESVVRDLSAGLEAGQSRPGGANTNDNDSGRPTSGELARDVTQDYHSSQVPTYDLPASFVDRAGAEGPAAGDQPLAWHNQVCEMAGVGQQAGSAGNEHAASATHEQAAPERGPEAHGQDSPGWEVVQNDSELSGVVKALAEEFKEARESGERNAPDVAAEQSRQGAVMSAERGSRGR